MPDKTESKFKNYFDQVVDAAFLHSTPNCYFVGPFANRVSFASQQYRVLDLIQALVNGKVITPLSNVAIIGAGLSGLMAAVALHKHKCTIHIFESQREFLPRQRRASHRVVHPTISRWPLEELEHTTCFPFLNWFAAPCHTIVNALDDEWKTQLEPGLDEKRFAPFAGITVNKLAYAEEGGEKRVVLNVNGQHDKLILYDVVIVTTGYGTERSIDGYESDSYWEPDDVSDEETLNLWRQSDSTIVISGCGDGGLIDCLRVIHGDFREGWLAVELAEMLGARFADEISRAERDALRSAKSIGCMPGPEKSDWHKRSAECRLYVEMLRDVYLRLASQLPDEAKQLLDTSVAQSNIQPGRVKLISLEQHPFVPSSAPIHKLMIAYAIKRGTITHLQGSSRQFDSSPDREDGTGRFIYEDHTGRERIIDNAHLVVRHGAPATMIDEVGDHEMGSLKIRQQLLADYIDLDVERLNYFDARHLLSEVDAGDAEFGKNRFMNAHYDKAQMLIRQIAPDVVVTADSGGFKYHTVDTAVANGADRPARLRLRLPGKIFGIEAQEADIIESSLL